MVEQIRARIRNFVSGRMLAYRQVFNPNSRDAERVLYDLAKFCRANETCFHADPRVHAVLEGRREVWNRIQHHLQLSDEQLWKLYSRKDLEP